MTASPDLVRIASDRLSAGINPLGAELHTLQDGDGLHLLWDGDPAYWTGRAPILFPIVGGLNGDRLRSGGRDYTLPKHGFARRSLFTVTEQTAASATFSLSASAATRAVYPFDFQLDVRFAIEAARLSMTAEVTNPGADPLPASFGFHPALRWPLPWGAARADHVLRFDAPEPGPIRRLDAAGLIDPHPRPTPVQGRDLPLSDALFADDALIFDPLASEGARYGPAAGRGLRIAWRDCPQLGVWMKPGADYICIEPWRGFADPQGFDGDFADKPGIFTVAPGESRRMQMSIEAEG